MISETVSAFLFGGASFLTYVQMFYSFFKTGLFSVGGGMATLPFLYEISFRYSWMSADIIPDMIAVSEATPGSLGINMATYAGFGAAGLAGAVVATAALIMPSVIVIILIIRSLPDFFERKEVRDIMYILRPTVLALVAAVGWNVLSVSVFPEGFDAFQEAVFDAVSVFPDAAGKAGYVSAAADALYSVSGTVFVLQIVVFSVLFYIMHKKGGNMILYIIASAVLGILLKLRDGAVLCFRNVQPVPGSSGISDVTHHDDQKNFRKNRRKCVNTRIRRDAPARQRPLCR
ncbi:chromate transporter [Methanosarcinaceae archaeon]|nr:chromate transporter [Methanosarcinaceae archaeon]